MMMIRSPRVALAVAVATVAMMSTASALARSGDSRDAEKNYLGSPSYQPVTTQEGINYLLQREPTAAGQPAPTREGRFRDSRSVENNYLASPTYRPVESDGGLNYLLEKEPTAAGALPKDFGSQTEGPYRIRGR